MANVNLIVGAVAVLVGLGVLLYEFAYDSGNQQQNSHQNGYQRNTTDEPLSSVNSISLNNGDRRRRQRRRNTATRWENIDCTICLERLGQDVRKVICGHSFHRQCIDVWLNEGHTTCPNCRKTCVG